VLSWKADFLPKSVSLTSIQPVMVPERFPCDSAERTITILRLVDVFAKNASKCFDNGLKSMFFIVKKIIIINKRLN
jgi:hypothetical protein